MSDQVDDEKEAILRILRGSRDGVKIADIMAELDVTMARRTVLRRLNELLESGSIQSVGEKSARRYFIEKKQFEVPLSNEAEKLKNKIMQPLQQRAPVPYNVDFLRDYQPNKTFYLSEKERAHLKAIGSNFEQQLEPGTYVKRILDRLLIDLSWNSSRLEGNTYSLLETKRLIDLGIKAEGKAALEAQMIMNHRSAIEFIVEHIREDLTKYVVLGIHALLSNGLLSNLAACGRIRNIPVGVASTVYTPLEIPQVIEECFQLIIDKAKEIEDPFEESFFLMVHIPYLQAFEDVNKRVSRLAANIPLIRENFSPLSFIDVPKDDYVAGLLAVYELNRVELLRDLFIWAYERSAKQYKQVKESIKEPKPIRFRYQNEIKLLVKLIVSENYQGQELIDFIQSWAGENVSKEHRSAFCHEVENDIGNLHSDNIVIYDIEPKQFETWIKNKPV